MFKQPMRTNFEDVHATEWLSVQDLLGFLAELNLVESTYKGLEISVPEHFSSKREELTSAIRVMYRVSLLKEVVMLEQRERNMRTTEEQREDTRKRITELKGQLNPPTGDAEIRKIDAGFDGNACNCDPSKLPYRSMTGHDPSCPQHKVMLSRHGKK